MTNTILRLSLAFALALAACSTISIAEASVLGGTLTSGLNTLNDVNREVLNKGALAIDDPMTISDETNDGSSAVVQVGDTLESILLFDNISNLNGNYLVSSVPGLAGLTAYSKIIVASKIDVGGGDFKFTFKAGFADTVTAVEVYESALLDDIGDYDTLLTRPAAITAATTGDLLFTLTLGGLGDFWSALGTDDLTLVSTGNPVNFKFGLSIGINPALVPIVLDGVVGAGGASHDVRGSGQVFNLPNPVFANGWQAASNTQVEFLAAPVPELASLGTWAVLVACTSVCFRKLRSLA